jgi:hypothetical protein
VSKLGAILLIIHYGNRYEQGAVALKYNFDMYLKILRTISSGNLRKNKILNVAKVGRKKRK